MSNIRAVIDIDSALSEGFNGVFGESVSESKNDDISVQFQYNYLDTQFDVYPAVLTGDGVASTANSLLTVSSASSGTSEVYSRDSLRYRPAHTGYCFFTASFAGTGTGRVGIWDSLDGFQLKCVSGNLSFGYLKNGVETGSDGAAGFDDQADWNGDYSPSNLDLTKLNIYMITFGYLGVANPTLWVKKDRWRVLHTVKTEGRLSTTHVDTPVLPVTVKAENGMSLSTGSWCGGTYGGNSPVGGRGFAFPNIALSGTGTITQGEMTVNANTTQTIAVFRSKSTFHGKANHVKSSLTAYNFEVDIPSGNVLGRVQFQLVGCSALSGAGSWTDINTDSSVIEYDHDDTTGTGASVNPSGTIVPLINDVISYVGSNKGGSAGNTGIDAESIGAFAYAGDIFAIVAKNVGNGNVVVHVSLNWEELF